MYDTIKILIYIYTYVHLLLDLQHNLSSNQTKAHISLERNRQSRLAGIFFFFFFFFLFDGNDQIIPTYYSRLFFFFDKEAILYLTGLSYIRVRDSRSMEFGFST